MNVTDNRQVDTSRQQRPPLRIVLHGKNVYQRHVYIRFAAQINGHEILCV